ncbi:MAG TPA: endolytic transglycosylase MltG, partial [Caulobacteraceae bacterium]
RQSELAAPTAYNTYHFTGLPPSPICNPGRASIAAVLDPAHTDDLYFVANGTGGHSFAATLEQHEKNVERWRGIEHQRTLAPAEPAPAHSALRGEMSNGR